MAQSVSHWILVVRGRVRGRVRVLSSFSFYFILFSLIIFCFLVGNACCSSTSIFVCPLGGKLVIECTTGPSVVIEGGVFRYCGCK